jgi:hypothetical protein
MARSLNARRVACDCCSVYFLTEDETKTTCAWCAKQAKKEIAQ